MKNEIISIKGARENNLKDISLDIPRNKFVIMTGVSGSGKTSLAFDTIYAEGQRRYVESLSAYARQFLGNSEKPDVDSIEGLSPSISIDQKTTSNNPRSTVGTATEIYDYLRLLYARVGVPYCPNHNEPITSQTIKQMVDQVMELEDKTRIQILAPVVHNKKGTHKDLLEKLLKEGYVRARIDGEVKLIEEVEALEKNKRHDIHVVVDRIVKGNDRGRIHDSLETALKLGDGLAVVTFGDKELLFSSNYSCKYCGFNVPKLEPRLFSFNAPFGACDTCKGLGITQRVDLDILIPDRNLSIMQGGIVYYKNILRKDNLEWQRFKALCDHYKIDLDKPLKKFTKKEMDVVLYGSKEPISYKMYSKSGNVTSKTEFIEGVVTLIERRFMETTSSFSREWYASFMMEDTCPDCGGRRLNEIALSVRVGGLNIYEWTQMSIKQAIQFMKDLKLTTQEKAIANMILKEIENRLVFLNDVGLNYLTLDRLAGTLSGGEAQRIRLATQIGSHLTGVLYVLDEPSIGLHQRDNDRLIDSLKKMRDLGNTLVVVEHDEETMRQSDYIVDIGPGAGIHGGEVVAHGTLEEIIDNTDSVTANYLSGRSKIEIPKERKKGNGKSIQIVKGSENNLKDVDVKFPLGTLSVVTGVSGSGKSSLVNEILSKGIAHSLGRVRVKPGKYKQIKGVKNIDKIINISQDPIGRTPRSNPATYTSVFDDIRDLFSKTPEAKIRGYEKGRFSFNVKGGRCEACQGDGILRISMHFLPDVYVPCEECGGKRYNEETLQVTYKGKNIYDVLDMSVEESIEFFKNVHKIKHKLQTLYDVGLGYIKLGQSATTLSGGEAQRVKLASELQRKATGKTLFVLDEPTTGLHSSDVKTLLSVLKRIVDNGDTVVVIEHNLDVIKSADYIIDIGPEGGDEGGTIMGCGTPEEISEIKASYTGQYLKKVLEEDRS
ncbi:excinuclease ABC subunit A [Breznakia sp. PF5-3]|uniref:excinuclease ABC subunit UvrA n=1 Tax=unclassified Breznakia TaxID=2623764 RepID=UPI00240751FE|nr:MULTISPECIES: excinuclease ABC subunit UvrA [unclassified Breznakia]MDF9825210.1 excinuclease ABC subunit A [Breznakia sp. PM6-1]MDF9836091.1 excinuclease ABC subunit A [Breznakia sp. PF5-3]MDF9838657.1 excinuclease ABC subunit A [Breznakia sp. PFB2-8]MDF9860688.1 excinuclease ABC subunit A [Breznakia sp. PH5-24]